MAHPLGPYPLPGCSPAPLDLGSLPSDVRGKPLRQSDEWIAGRLSPFNGRARVFLSALLGGASIKAGAIMASLSTNTIDRWRKDHPEFKQAVEDCLNAGFATVIEAELYRRALAGSDDRGSMRALELIVRARAPEYREQRDTKLSVMVQAADTMSSLVAGWQARSPDERLVSAPSPADGEDAGPGPDAPPVG